jgi:hypothetical protein
MLPSLTGPHLPEEVDTYLDWAKKFISAHRPSPAINPSLGNKVMDVAIDFDDTLFHSLWTPENRTREIGEPIWNNIMKALDLVEAGYQIIIHTARGWEDEQAIRDACAAIDLPIHYVVCAKPLARMYVDDRALHESCQSWMEIVNHQENVDAVDVVG